MGQPPQARGRCGRAVIVAALALALATGLLVLQPAAGFPGTNGGIAFSRGGEVWVMNADGTNPTPLTAGGGPAFSADATRIAFVRNGSVHRMSSDGTGVTPLTTGADPAWSPDGSHIAFVRDGGVHVMNAGGADVMLLATGGDPAWSPDGTQIAFVQGGSVSVMRADGTGVAPLATGGDPAWSPDGTQIAFVQDGSVSVIRADGTGAAPLATGADPVWSPDGTKITFAQAGEVWVMNADGSAPAALTTGGGSEPDWGVGGAPVNTSLPTLTGTAAAGSTLTASRGAWTSSSPLAYTYQWRRCDSAGGACVDIAGATASTYTLTTTDIGSRIRAAVTAASADGSATAEAAATTVVAAAGTAPVSATAPIVSGTATVGSVLASNNGTWTGASATFTRVWKRCNSAGTSCSAIPGATGTHYVVVTADAGSRLQVEVTATNPAGSATRASAPTAVVTSAATASAPVNTVAPSISGTPRVGQAVSVFRGSWTGTPTPNYSYQWQRCDAGGSSCSDLAGATQSSYTPSSAQLGSRLRVIVTATNASGSASATSPATTAIAAASTSSTGSSSPSTSTAPRNTTRPRVTGTAVQGSTLSAAPGSWTGSAPITYTYQWERCDEEEDECDEVTGATRSTYTVVRGDVGSRLRVMVTATNSTGDDVETSEATDVVKASSAAGSKPVTGSKPAAGKPSSGRAKGRTIRGTRKADVLVGGLGNDRILPGRGADTVVAGAGNDVIAAADGARDVVVCGAGRDRVVADRMDVLRGCEVVVRVRIAPGSKEKRR